MSLFDAWYRAVARRSPAGEQRDVRRQMADLERLHGSGAAAARAVGVNKGTWWRWKSGRATPKPENLDRVRLSRRQALVPDSRRRTVSRSTGRAIGGFRITGMVTISADTRYRTISLGPALDAGRLDTAMTAFLAGDDAAVEAELQAALVEVMGQPVEVTDPTITF